MRTARRTGAALIVLAGLLAGPARAQSDCQASAPEVQAFDQLDGFHAPLAHPLIGTVLDLRPDSAGTDTCRPVRLSQLAHELRRMMFSPRQDTDAKRLLVLGEVHDNPTHHALRARLLRSIGDGHRAAGDRPKPPAFVFEHIRADQQGAVDVARSYGGAETPAAIANRIFMALAWADTGWPDQAIFSPLIEAALELGAPIMAGDPPADKVRMVARSGLGELPSEERRRLHLDEPLAPPLQDALLDELEASHCGLMPRARFGTMADAQRYRDAHLAAALVAAGRAQGTAVLLAGNGHARRDRGVPSLLGADGPGGRIVSVMLIEVEAGRTEPTAYLHGTPNGGRVADFVVFTPQHERADPCIAMKKQFGKP